MSGSLHPVVCRIAATCIVQALLAESRMYAVVHAAISDAATVYLCVTSSTFLTLSSRSQTDRK
jgi:hypothetical protein